MNTNENYANLYADWTRPITAEAVANEPALFERLINHAVATENMFGQPAVLALPVGLQLLLLIANLNNIVENGGYEQFFERERLRDWQLSSVVEDTIKALEKFGATSVAVTTKDAAAAWSSFTVPADPAIGDYYESVSEAMMNFNVQYYRRKQDLVGAIENYAREHPGDFVAAGRPGSSPTGAADP